MRQGDPLSPNLLNYVLEEIFRKMDWEEKGRRVKMNGKLLNDLRFADDVVLIGKMREELQVEERSREAGLEDNFEKTKLMSNRKGEREIKMKNGVVEEVKSYTSI